MIEVKSIFPESIWFVRVIKSLNLPVSKAASIEAIEILCDSLWSDLALTKVINILRDSLQ